jgi:hypothetical protein
MLSPETGETVTGQDTHLTGSKASGLTEAQDGTVRVHRKMKTHRRQTGLQPEMVTLARSKIQVVGRAEHVDSRRKEAVKGRQQRRSRKNRRRLRLGEVSNSEGPNPTGASGAE